MPNRCLFALGLTVFAGSAAMAQTAPYAFVGSLVITARAGADCDAVSANVGELHTSVFRPRQAGVPAASLQLFEDQTALQMRPAGNTNFPANGQYSARMFTGRGGFLEYTGNHAGLRVRPAPTPTTKVIDISGRITNFRNGGQCTVTVTGGFVLKAPPEG
jgi:hypothetical protein